MTRLLPILFLSHLVFSCASPLSQTSPTAGRSANQSTQAHLEAAAKEGGFQLRRFDLNRDERPDVYKFYHVEYAENGEVLAETLVRKDVDVNNDGKIDITRYFDHEQKVREEHTDLDFDGAVDSHSFFTDGKLSRREIDINYDGEPDIVKRYKNGMLTVIESDRKGDGKIDTWEYFESDTLNRIGRDTDADGKIDIWERSTPAG